MIRCSQLFFLSTKFVRSDTMKTGCTLEIPVVTKKRKLASTGTNTTDTESKNEDSMRTQGTADLCRNNSLLNPAWAVHDLDTIPINPTIFDNAEV